MRSRKKGTNKNGALILVGSLLLSTLIFLCGPGGSDKRTAYAKTDQNSEVSAKAFLIASQTLLHPRCVNCHPEGDSPLVGDQSQPHPMSIKRGPEGVGVAGLSCKACHQDTNLPEEHTPPGAPQWRLPTKNMPMVFQKRTPRQLCEQLKDPAQNGGRNLDQILVHVREAPLVLWGWNPGNRRTPAPGSHDEFVRVMTEWVKGGAACPE
jgi:hypothetical protein